MFVAGGFDPPKDDSKPPARRTRVPVAEFAAAISLGTNEAVDGDEVECLLANMIYKVCETFILDVRVFEYLVTCGSDESIMADISGRVI